MFTFMLQIVMEWIKRVACNRGLDERHIPAASAAVLTYGSYGLGVSHLVGSCSLSFVSCFPLVSSFISSGFVKTVFFPLRIPLKRGF